MLNGYEFIKPRTRDRVLEAIASLDYRPNMAARALATSRSGIIGIVASDYISFGPASALWAVEQAAHEAGYGVSVVGLGESSMQTIDYALTRLAGQGVEGIVMIAPQDAAVRAVYQSIQGIPVVTLSGFDEGYDQPIMVDSVEGSRAATQHLIDLGHQRILHLSGPAGFEVSELRVRGWRQALIEWVGDVARALVDGQPVDDRYFTGRTWMLPRDLLGDAREVTVEILSLDPAAPVYLPDEARAPVGDGRARLRSARVHRVERRVLGAAAG